MKVEIFISNLVEPHKSKFIDLKMVDAFFLARRLSHYAILLVPTDEDGIPLPMDIRLVDIKPANGVVSDIQAIVGEQLSLFETELYN